ncbi:cardiolipin synthase ClsB [Polyangium aurulentum]|uniref:cardiolipin synthase ClsB n=1 Tax=Polyangium aurulentum TaxID=2567896 RepID=UPI001F34A305|nr:cardiolipin synthase ClsB [Polyangium aurulentum]
MSRDAGPLSPRPSGGPSSIPQIDVMPSIEAIVHSGERLLSPAFSDLLVGYHRLRLLRDGEQTFPAMLEAIRRARSTICFETYILRDDRTGQRFAEALMDRARAGVEVNLLYDAWGSSVSNEFVRALRAAGVRAVEFRPIRFSFQSYKIIRQLAPRNHRKSLIVDNNTAFTGGINIADDYASVAAGGEGWRDTHLCLEGPAAQEMQYFFLRTWRKAKGDPIDEPRYAHLGRRPDHMVRVVTSDMRKGRTSIRDWYRNAIDRAQKRIYITNAYFLPTLRLLRELQQAARRGVDVRIMVAGTTDVTAVLLASRSIYGRLLEAGARMYEWKGRVLHAKTAVFDGHWATVGSSNLDQQSLRLNLESNVIVEDSRFAGAMEAMFQQDLEHCDEITSEEWRDRPLWQRAASWVAYLFRDWL